MNMNCVIVSRHLGLVEWLRRNGIEGEVIEHVESVDQIANKTVVGNLPLALAAECWMVISVDMPGLPLDKRGKDITPEEMDSYGAVLKAYSINEYDISKVL